MGNGTQAAGGGVIIREAAEADLADLASVSATRAMHADRIRDAQLGWMDYLVGEIAGRVVGFGLIVYSAPPHWDRREHVPVLVNLYVRADQRSRGIGTALIGEMVARAARRGFRAIYLRVEPENNPRAFALYRRLGFEPLQDKPFRDPYHFVDSAGCVHEGVEWNVEMIKRLSVVSG